MADGKGEVTPSDTPTSRAAHLTAYQFKEGNPGRPKGARNKLAESFLDALYEDFTEHGIEAIRKTRTEKPDQYIRTVASILPKEIEAGERMMGAIGELLSRIDGTTRLIGASEPVTTGRTVQ